MGNKHDHNIVDSDLHFTIDPTTRSISNTSKKTSLIQYDHNSERFSFDIPKEIDGYDLSLCGDNLCVEIQYQNIDATSRTKYSYVYVVDDVHESTTDKNKLEFSWLIPSNATEYAGILQFSVVITCKETVPNTDPDAESDTKTIIVYRWGTAIFSSISINPGLLNGNEVYEKHLDMLDQWKGEVFDDIEDQVNEHLPTVIKLYESEDIL